MKPSVEPLERVAIVDGLRTPFAKRGTAYAHLSALDLASAVVAELVDRSGVPVDTIDRVVYGQVVLDVEVPNIAREIVLRTRLPAAVEAHSVSKACITSYQTAADVAHAIALGDIRCGIAGGADSASAAPLVVTEQLESALKAFASADSLGARLRALAKLDPRALLPRAPDLTEPSTGETMGEGAERMAKINQISRSDQDDFAHRSHVLAARAWNEGRFTDDVMSLPVPPAFDQTVEVDGLVRFESDRRSYTDLSPVFDRSHGTITAGNSTPLTDGAAALLMMSESLSRQLGLAPLGFVRSTAFTAVDPAGQLLIGPVHATPIALDRAGVVLADIDLIDMHEAFAAQMLTVLRMFGSDSYAQQHLGRDKALGEVDMSLLNVNGGSIAVGHPFAATGARQIAQTLRELRRRGGELALCTACAAGGLGAAMVLEAA
ncbi:MAG: acetyl-CoA C-acyltransferase FadI [Acidimicrobiales bacterium]